MPFSNPPFDTHLFFGKVALLKLFSAIKIEKTRQKTMWLATHADWLTLCFCVVWFSVKAISSSPETKFKCTNYKNFLNLHTCSLLKTSTFYPKIIVNTPQAALTNICFKKTLSRTSLYSHSSTNPAQLCSSIVPHKKSSTSTQNKPKTANK